MCLVPSASLPPEAPAAASGWVGGRRSGYGDVPHLISRSRPPPAFASLRHPPRPAGEGAGRADVPSPACGGGSQSRHYSLSRFAGGSGTAAAPKAGGRAKRGRVGARPTFGDWTGTSAAPPASRSCPLLIPPPQAGEGAGCAELPSPAQRGAAALPLRGRGSRSRHYSLSRFAGGSGTAAAPKAGGRAKRGRVGARPTFGETPHAWRCSTRAVSPPHDPR